MTEKLEDLLKSKLLENIDLFYNITENQLTENNCLDFYFLCLIYKIEVKDYLKNFIKNTYFPNQSLKPMLEVHAVSNLLIERPDCFTNKTAEYFYKYSKIRTHELLTYAGYKLRKS